MNFEPQKFFIGLVDFFSVWLPGAILAYLLTITPPLGDRLNPTGIEDWTVFLIGSYLLGHFIFLLGSQLDHVYDWLRKGTRDGQIDRLAEGKKMSWPLTRFFGQFLFGKHDPAVRNAVRIKVASLAPIGASGGVNAFQWSKARLAVEKPDGLGLVHRFEADSKFFRSLVIMLIVGLPWQILAHRPLLAPLLAGNTPLNARIALVALLAVAAVGLLALSFWRFVDLRVKSTSQAYWLILALEGERKGVPRKAAPRRDGMTHSGGVVVRKEHDGWKFLVVKARRDPNQWVLPKGHIEPGEPMPATAVREVLEETGVWASPVGKLDDINYQCDDENVSARFYLMNYLREKRPRKARLRWLRAMDAFGDSPRETGWAVLSEAGIEGAGLADEARDLVEIARGLVRQDDQASSGSASAAA